MNQETREEFKKVLGQLEDVTEEDAKIACRVAKNKLLYLAASIRPQDKEAELLNYMLQSTDLTTLAKRLKALIGVEENESMAARLFVDMDGTLAQFKKVDTLETLYEEGYFRNLLPNENVVKAVRRFMEMYPEKEVYIMSSVLSDSPYAQREKNQWIDYYLPEIDSTHRIFVPCGEEKVNYIPGTAKETDYLLDDYTKNLSSWEPPAKGIKLLNGINHTKGTWHGLRLSYEKEPAKLARHLAAVMEGAVIRDAVPQKKLEQRGPRL